MEDAEYFGTALALSTACIGRVVDMDWSVPAGTLDWTCWQTVDHMVDCVFSFAMQLSAQAPSGFLPFNELHALTEAAPSDLHLGLEAVGYMFSAVLRSVPPGRSASDGVVDLGVTDWARRGGYELLLHTHDVSEGLGVAFEPPASMCAWILGSRSLWMFARERAENADSPWMALLTGSGRHSESGPSTG
ncbi:MAG: hypothetical protein ABSC30_12550 [Acidimicrobiales bacterium]